MCIIILLGGWTTCRVIYIIRHIRRNFNPTEFSTPLTPLHAPWPQWEAMYDIKVMKNIKKIFDPCNILNPGKFIDIDNGEAGQ